LLLSLAAFGQPQSITIGRFKFVGNGPPGTTSTYEAVFDTTGVTQEPITVWANIIVGASAASSGLVQTPYVWKEFGSDAYVTPLWACDCPVIALQVVLATEGPVTFTLADGSEFKTASIVTVVIHSKPGKDIILAGQSVPIVLTRIK
jgi:hypothetical protein